MRGSGRTGLVFGVAAYGIWGLFPLYWPLLRPASALEILAHRVLWSLLVLLVVLGGTRQLRRAAGMPAGARRRLMVAGCAIAVNWGTYIYGVNHHHVVETSLGYFINPLVTVALGVLVLGESLRRVQVAALAVGAAAVLVVTAGYGRPPWLALLLAASFGGYGLLKKQVAVPALDGLLVETATLAVPAALLVVTLAAAGHATAVDRGAGHLALFATTGVITVVPLLLFAGAARRLPLTSVGLLQYLAPVLQLAVGVAVEHESLTGTRLVGFALVWVALLMLGVDSARRRPTGAPVPAAPADSGPAAGLPVPTAAGAATRDATALDVSALDATADGAVLAGRAAAATRPARVPGDPLRTTRH